MRSKSFYLPTIVIVTVLIISCAGTNSPIELKRSEIKYSKPQTATDLFEGAKVEFQLWFDKSTWKVIDDDDVSIRDIKELQHQYGRIYHELRHNFKFAVVSIMEYPKSATLEDLYKASKLVPDQIIIDREIRTVNNNKVLYIKKERVSGSEKLVLLNYFYSNKTGRVQVMVGTSKNLFAGLESDMFNLLNGLVNPDNY